MSQEAADPPRRKTGTTYAIVIAVAIVLGVIALIDIEILITDFIDANPYRSHGNALAMAFIEAPLIGLLAVVIAGAFGIAVFGVSAAVVHRLIGHVPLWALPIISFLCWSAIILQTKLTSTYLLPPDTGDGPAVTVVSRLPGMAGSYVYLLAATWIAWWLTRPRKLPFLSEVF